MDSGINQRKNTLQMKREIAIDRKINNLTYEQLQEKYSVSKSFARTSLKLKIN